MPRGMGARTGVNETVTCSPAASRSACSISGVCWWTPPTLYVESWPMTELAEQRVARLAAGAGRAARGDDHDVVGLDEAGGEQRREPEDDARRVAAGVGDAPRRGDLRARGRQLGHAVGPGARVVAAVVARPRLGVARAGGRRRGRPRACRSGSAAASAADSPCGSARNTTSAPPSVSRSVATNVRSARAVRRGCRSVTRLPALPPASSGPTSNAGWASSRRTSSPPA